MNGADHYAAAEVLLERAERFARDADDEAASLAVAGAQAHATLALAYATHYKAFATFPN